MSPEICSIGMINAATRSCHSEHSVNSVKTPNFRACFAADLQYDHHQEGALKRGLTKGDGFMKTHCRIVPGILITGMGLLATIAMAEDTTVSARAGDISSNRAIWLGICAALTMAMSVMGAAYAVARIGSAAMGAAAEKPELLTRCILFVALAEGLAVLGFAISMMLIQKI